LGEVDEMKKLTNVLNVDVRGALVKELRDDEEEETLAKLNIMNINCQ
jgi:hypothetical protein